MTPDLKCHYDQIQVPKILGLSHRIPGKIANAVYRNAIHTTVKEIFKFEKCGKYANEKSADVIDST